MFIVKFIIIIIGLLVAAALCAGIFVAAHKVSETKKQIEFEELEERIM